MQWNTALFSEVMANRTLENGTAIHSHNWDGKWSWGREAHWRSFSELFLTKLSQVWEHNQSTFTASEQNVLWNKHTDVLHRTQCTKYRLSSVMLYSTKAFQLLRWKKWWERFPNNDKLDFPAIEQVQMSGHLKPNLWKHKINTLLTHKLVFSNVYLVQQNAKKWGFASLLSKGCKKYIPEHTYIGMSMEPIYFCSSWEIKLHCRKPLKWFLW